MNEFFVVVEWIDGNTRKFNHITSIDAQDFFYVMRDRDGVVYRINRNSVDMVTENIER